MREMKATRPVAEKVRVLIEEQLCLNTGEAKPDYDLVTDLDADSLDIVEVVITCEEYFDIEIADGDVLPLKTVQNWVDYIDKKLSERKGSK